jgi:hypothetical protein
MVCLPLAMALESSIGKLQATSSTDRSVIVMMVVMTMRRRRKLVD